MEVLAQGYHGAVRAFLAAYVHDPALTDELTQEFFLSWVTRGMPRLKPELGSFRRYLKGALRHFVLNHARSLRAARRVGEVALDPDLASRGASPEEAFDGACRSRLLNEAVEAMLAEYAFEGRPRHGEAFRLYYIDRQEGEQPTYGRLAVRLSASESEVRSWLAHGRRRLRSHVSRLVRDSVSSEEAFRREMEALYGGAGGSDGRAR